MVLLKGLVVHLLGAGAFIELGPFRPSGYNLVKNEYSWNKAQDSLLFLKLWFAKFPEYQNRDFFIAGKSYADYEMDEARKMVD